MLALSPGKELLWPRCTTGSGSAAGYLVQLPGLSLGGAKYPAVELRDAAGGTLAAWQGEHLTGLGLEME